jgi:glycosyltransferase involved in cell wall biosynthesis
MKLGFYSACATDPRSDIFGYGSAYYAIRPELERMAVGTSYTISSANDNCDFQIYFGMPVDEHRKYYKRKSDRLWCFTMWESTIVNRELMNNLKRFDGLIVPSAWCVDVFRSCGFNKPIRVAPLGITPDKWPYVERDSSRKPFKILWQGTALFDRKGAVQTLRAFNELNLPDSELWIKMNTKYAKIPCPHRFMDIPLIWLQGVLEHELCFDKINNIVVRAIGETLSKEDMQELLAGVDLSVYPSRGEGFGLIPLEHMQSGLPVIIADNSGMHDYINPEYMIPLPCVERCSTFGEEFGLDYEADYEALKKAIKWAYDNRGESLEMGRKASVYVRQDWNSQATAQKIIDIVEEITGVLK